MFKFEFDNEVGKVAIELKSCDINKAVEVADFLFGTLYFDKENIAYDKKIKNLEPYLISNTSENGQTTIHRNKLGEYKEPETGVRLKFYHFSSEKKMDMIRKMKNITGISLMFANDIITNKDRSPKFHPTIAASIIRSLKDIDTTAHINFETDEQKQT